MDKSGVFIDFYHKIKNDLTMKRIDTTDPRAHSNVLTTDARAHASMRNLTGSAGTREFWLAEKFRIHLVGMYFAAVGPECGSDGNQQADFLHHIEIVLSGKRQAISSRSPTQPMTMSISRMARGLARHATSLRQPQPASPLPFRFSALRRIWRICWRSSHRDNHPA